MVVDDSAVFRRLASQCLGELPGVDCVGTAADIKAAIVRLENSEIDVAIIDVALRGESGLDLLKWLREQDRGVTPFLMTAGNAEGVRTEVDALMLGAAGLLLKPSGPDAPARFVEMLGSVLQGIQPGKNRRTPSPGIAMPAYREVIAVGASTGGPPVLATFLQTLPADFDTPILIVQHIPELHVPYLADLLAQKSGRTVVLGKSGMLVERSTVYMACDAKHMLVNRSGSRLVIVQSDAEPEHHCRPAVDPLFRSVAAACGSSSVGVVMTGMGSDGALGAVALAARGAPVIVQDQKTSVIWSMPGAVFSAGAATAIASSGEIANYVDRWTASRRAPSVVGGNQ